VKTGARIPTTTSTIHLSRKALDCSILATSRQVYQEAASIFATRLQQLAKNPVRLQLPWSKVGAFIGPNCESGIRACFDARHNFRPNVLITEPLTYEFTKHFFFYLQHARRICATATGSHDIEPTLTMDEDARVSYREIVFFALWRILTASDNWKLSLKVVHGYCPPVRYIGRTPMSSIAQTFQLCRMSLGPQVLECRGEMAEIQELSQEDWTQHLETWGH
jgi:hypothetical protein